MHIATITGALVATLPLSALAAPPATTSGGDYDWGFTLWRNDDCSGFKLDLLGHSIRSCQPVSVYKSFQPNATVSSNKVVRFYSTTDCSGVVVARIGGEYTADVCGEVAQNSQIRGYDILELEI